MDTDLVYMSAYMLIRKVFGCGLDAAVFKRHYELLSLNDQQVLERVERVAWRMMVADILRLRIRFRLPFDLREVSTLARFNDSELPSLELFYLFGCLDTLAGSDHLQYPEWLKQESKAGRLKLDDADMNVSQLIRMFETYQRQHGVGSRLRRLFSPDVLSGATVEWLLANAAIFQTIEDEDTFLDEKNQHKLTDTTAILNHWRAFFYELHRNPFAHQSKAKNIFMPEDVMWAAFEKPVGEWELRSGTMHYKLGSKWWTIMWRQEVDESLVLRVLVEGAVLALMAIPVTSSTVAHFVRAQMRSRKFIGFRDEVEKNGSNLVRWTSIFEPNDNHSLRLREFDFARLDSAWTASVSDMFDSAYLRENDLHQDTVRYLKSVREINKQMDAFRSTISAIENDADRLSAVIHFCTDLKNTNNFAFVIDMSDQMRTIGRIDDIIANPCHIYFTEI